MNTNYAAANFLSLPLAELKLSAQAIIKSSLSSAMHEKRSIIQEGSALNSGSGVVVNPSGDGKNLKDFLNDLQSVFKEQRDEGLKSIVSDQHKKGGSQGQNGTMQQSSEQSSESIKHRQCSLNDFFVAGSKIVSCDDTALLDILNTNVPAHLQKAINEASAMHLMQIARQDLKTFDFGTIEFDIQTLKLTLKIVCALDEAMRMSSTALNIATSNRYYFDQSYMPYLYLLLFKSYALKERIKKEKTRYSDSLYRKKQKDDEARKENHMSMLL